MGFTIYYESTHPVPAKVAANVQKEAARLVQGYTWLSCEPVSFFGGSPNGKLSGGSKPNFCPHPDDIADAAREALPDGTVNTLLDNLCELSREFDVSWALSHDHDDQPMGFVKNGVCDRQLRQTIVAFGELVGSMQDEFDEPTSADSRRPPPSDDDDDLDENQMIFKFRPK